MIKIEYTGLTDTGLVRKANEDNLGFFESQVAKILTVCDGMGGHVGGATASTIAVNSILEHLSKSELKSPEIEINNAIVFANHAIIQTAEENPELKNMGTTCTVVVVKSDSIHIGHVGDSRIYLLSRNRLHRITKDHSFVQNLVDAGAIPDEEAENHPRKNELTRALGVKNVVEPTVSKQPIKPQKGDIFMLCSDGLCGLVSDRNMEDILNQNDSIELAANFLIQAAKNAGGHDNITVQLAKVVESNYTFSVFDDCSPKERLASTLIEDSLVRNSHKNEKFITKTNIILLSIIAALLISGSIFFFVSSEDKSQSKDDIANNTNKNTSVVPNTVKKDGSTELKCKDVILEGYLVHTVEEGDVISKLSEQHSLHSPHAGEYDFKITYNESNKIIKDVDIIKPAQKIKWKKKVTNMVNPTNVPGSSTNTDAPGKIPASTDNKNNSPKTKESSTPQSPADKDGNNSPTKEPSTPPPSSLHRGVGIINTAESTAGLNQIPDKNFGNKF